MKQSVADKCCCLNGNGYHFQMCSTDNQKKKNDNTTFTYRECIQAFEFKISFINTMTKKSNHSTKC